MGQWTAHSWPWRVHFSCKKTLLNQYTWGGGYILHGGCHFTGSHVLVCLHGTHFPREWVIRYGGRGWFRAHLAFFPFQPFFFSFFLPFFPSLPPLVLLSLISSSSTLGLGRLGDLLLAPVFTLLRDVGGGEWPVWPVWPVHIVGMVDRVAGMLGTWFDVAMGRR